MKISTGRTDYSQLEQEICELYLAAGDDMLDREFSEIKTRFRDAYPTLKEGDDYEFTDWHNNLRMLWVYLYSDDFYNSELISNTSSLIESMKSAWFLQFECYSKSFESKSNQIGAVGCFLVYKDSVVFDDCQEWNQLLKQIAV